MLGGQDEQFKTMTAVEINNDIFVIEAGFKHPDKTKPGIDFIIPRYDYLVENKEVRQASDGLCLPVPVPWLTSS